MRTVVTTLFVRLTIGAAVLLLLSTTGVKTQANDQIHIWVESGREFSGDVDRRTNDDCLWLRQSAPRMEIIRSVKWERITGAEHNGKRLSVAELRQLAAELKAPSTIEAPLLRCIQGNRIVMRGNPEAPMEADDGQSDADDPVAGPIQSVDFDAQIANWDGDVEPDGLLIQVYPLDAHGAVTPITGTLSVELIAPRRRDFNHVPHGRGTSVDRIGRWSRSIRREDVGVSGITFKLPFQVTHPEFNTDVWSYGLVHLRLVVPGHGVFEDSIDGVQIREFAPVRDWLQLSTGRRHFAHERTGRPKQ